MSIITRQRTQLPALLLDADWRGKYDRVQVYRSRLSESGPFSPLYGPSLLPALLTSTGVRPTGSVVDKELLLSVDGTEVRVVFPLGTTGYTSVATAIAAASYLLRARVDDEGRLEIRTASLGKESVLAVLGGDAAALLQLPSTEPASVAFGADPWPLLVEGNRYVAFEDVNGDDSYFYQFRYYSPSLSLLSSPKRVYPNSTALAPERCVLGFVEVLRGDGVPWKNCEVLVRTHPTTTLLEGALVSGAPGEGRFLTDERGRVTIQFVRGVTIEVVISGTTIARTLVVPTDPEVSLFNLLDPQLGKDDLFNVQVPNLRAATRRSL